MNKNQERKLLCPYNIYMDTYPSRKSMRLTGYDYSNNGYYYVTLCTHKRENLFGKIIHSDTIICDLNPHGLIAQQCWLDIPQHHPYVTLDTFIIMPNHVHGIIQINKRYNKNITHIVQKRSGTLGSIIRGYKIGVTKLIREHEKSDPVWQKSFYDHIISNETALFTIRNYILENPIYWDHDKNNITSPCNNQ